MFFRNVTFMQVFDSATLRKQFEPIATAAGMNFSMEPPPAAAHLLACALKPVGPLEMSSAGFVAPIEPETPLEQPTDLDLFVREGDAVWVTVATEQRMLPASVVNDHLARKLAEIEEREGRKLDRRSRKRVRDELLVELLPRAFVRRRRTDAVLLLDLGVLAVNTASRRAADAVACELRRALGSFQALPLNPALPPRGVLTGWLAGEPLPEPLALGWDCELREAMEHGARVRCNDQEPQSDEIAKHLEAGKQCTRLSLSCADNTRWTVDEGLTVRGLRFLEGAVEQLESSEHEDLRSELLARFLINATELRAIHGVMREAFKLEGQQP